MTKVHSLGWADFEALASGLGDSSAVKALRAGQQSKHLLQLRGLLDSAAAAGHRDVLEPGFTLLCAAHRTANGDVSDLLLHPPVGNWLAHCLRRLRGGKARDESPIEHELGYLGAIAAAAALRAGMDFEIRVRSRAGALMLPTLGLVVPGSLPPGAAVTVTSEAGSSVMVQGGGARVVIPADYESTAPGWTPLRRLWLDGDTRSLCVYLDDLDPFRDCHGSPTTQRLEEAAVHRWRELLAGAWSLLAGAHPVYAEAIAEGLRSIVPLRTLVPGRGTTATSPDSFGSCVMTEPADPVALAASLIHEFQHAKLGALMDLVPLHSASHAAGYYAPWRDDPRPFGGLLHGAYAFLGVTDFWRVQRTAASRPGTPFAHFEFARWREQTLHAVRTLQSSGALTELGTYLVAAMESRLQGWAGQVPAGPARAARDAIADHQLSWRLRNLRPAENRVRRIAAAWQAAEPCPPDDAEAPEVRSGGAALSDNGRRDLLLLRLREPGRFASLTERPGELTALIPSAAEPDVDYVRGDLNRAAEGYRRILRAQPEHLTAWAGLVLIRRNRRGCRADPLVDEPELVMAVCQRLSAMDGVIADPYELAEWIGAAHRH